MYILEGGIREVAGEIIMKTVTEITVIIAIKEETMIGGSK